MHARRNFFATAVVPAAALLLLPWRAALGAPIQLEESDPVAAALGYKADATKVSAKKFPSYVVGHRCANCVLFQAKPGAMSGACGAFGGKLVNAKGWCAAWAIKS